MGDRVLHSVRLASLFRQSTGLDAGAMGRWQEAEAQVGPEIFSQALYLQARLDVPPLKARALVYSILNHQREMAQSLGRAVSFITALSDYPIAMEALLPSPMLVSTRFLIQKEDSALRDELTGLFNRRYFNQELSREIERFRRFGHPFSLLMLDLDHFKDFNDTHGHSAGDQALRDIARLLGDSARLYDRAVRYGGEEFAIILPQACQDEALAVAERIREAAQEHQIEFGQQLLGPLTVSIGSATFPQDALDMTELVCRADEALYAAKQERNRVEAFRDSHRRHTRFLLSAPMPLHIHSDVVSELDAKTLDVSFGGLRCETRLNVAPDSTLGLVLTDSQRGLHLPLQARVRRIVSSGAETYHLGLSFELHSEEERKTLLALLEGRALVGFQPTSNDRISLPQPKLT